MIVQIAAGHICMSMCLCVCACIAHKHINTVCVICQLHTHHAHPYAKQLARCRDGITKGANQRGHRAARTHMHAR